MKSLTADSASLNEADIDNVELTEDDMVDPDLLRELKMMGYKETKPVNDDKKSLEDTMNEYKSKALQAKKSWRFGECKKYYKEFKILRAQIENQGKKKINVKQGQSKVVANSVHNKTSSSHPPQSHPKALKSLTADSPI